MRSLKNNPCQRCALAGIVLSVFSVVHPKQKQKSSNAEKHDPGIHRTDMPLKYYNQRNTYCKKCRHEDISNRLHRYDHAFLCICIHYPSSAFIHRISPGARSAVCSAPAPSQNFVLRVSMVLFTSAYLPLLRYPCTSQQGSLA